MLTRSTMHWLFGGNRQPELGIRADPGRVAQPRPPARCLDDPADPQAPPDPTGTGPAHRHQLAAAPAHPSHQHARGRLLPRRRAITLRRLYVLFALEVG